MQIIYYLIIKIILLIIIIFSKSISYYNTGSVKLFSTSVLITVVAIILANTLLFCSIAFLHIILQYCTTFNVAVSVQMLVDLYQCAQACYEDLKV